MLRIAKELLGLLISLVLLKAVVGQLPYKVIPLTQGIRTYEGAALLEWGNTANDGCYTTQLGGKYITTDCQGAWALLAQ